MCKWVVLFSELSPLAVVPSFTPLRIYQLSRFLGTKWLSDDHINMMIEEARTAFQDGSNVHLVGVSFSVEIGNVKIKLAQRRDARTLLASLRKRVEGGLEKLYFPLHIGESHWIAGEIDFIRKSIAFGDSLHDAGHGPGAPHKFIMNLQTWLKAITGRHFHNRGNSLVHAVQDDSFSCGVITMNTILHAATGEHLWQKKRASEERLVWFNRLASSACKKIQEKQQPIPQDTRLKLSTLLNAEPPKLTTAFHYDSSSSSTSSSNRSQSIISAIDNNKLEDVDRTTSSPYSRPQSVARGSQSDGLSMALSENTSFAYESDGQSVIDNNHASHPASSACSVVTDGYTSDLSSPVSHDPPDVPLRYNQPTTSSPPRGQSYKRQRSPSASSSSLSSISRILPRQKPVAKRKKQADKQSVPTLKRHRQPSSSSSYFEGSSGDSPVREPAPKRKKPAAGEGTSKSALHRRNRMEKLKKGEEVVDQKKLDAWKAKIRKLDPHARFTEDVREVGCSKCGRVVVMKDVCNVARFKEHLEATGCAEKKGRVVSLFAMGFTKKAHSKETTPPASEPSPAPRLVPCPGVTKNDDPRIETYLQRTTAGGGGGRLLPEIAKEKFKKLFSQLGSKRKREVLDTQQQEWRWTNDHENARVFSTECKKNVPERAPHPPRPCNNCIGLLKIRAFKAVISKEKPKDENYKHVNKRFRPKVLGELYARIIGVRELIEDDARSSPYVRYTKGALKGKYNNEVFNGLMEAMVTKEDKISRGVGMQNFTYSPAWEEFCHITQIHSPRAYKAFREHFPAPDPRNLRKKEARQPRFPMSICDRSFELVVEHLSQLNYTGPVGLSCDDTKLFATFRLYWDATENSHFLVGATDGPIRVADPEKIRLWCLTIPAPKVAPIIVAAIPISDKMDAPELLDLHMKIMDGLIDRKIMVISYACDGTETERKVQKLFMEKAEKVEVRLRDPRPGHGSLLFVFAKYRGQAICIVQDSKHALKTLRNNLFSGARFLVLGNFTAMYRRILQLVKNEEDAEDDPDGPLHYRDVIKVDRQDDAAAVRLFSADTLQYLADNHPDSVGEIVYLFVFGELIDAYQNRRLSHLERIEMVLRAHFFLDIWERYLDACKYRRSRYFISREASDILRILINGFMALIFIHRDHMPEGLTPPLLAWLYSSESNEHIFGEGRKVVKDFAFLDFIYMLPKLRIKLHEAVLRGKASSGKERASGYSHTYFDHEGLDITNLSTFPSNSEIETVSAQALQQAGSLAELLGFSLDRIYASARQPLLPTIDAWFDDGSDNISLASDDEDYLEDRPGPSEMEQLQELLDAEEASPISRRSKTDAQCLTLTSAALALVAEDITKVNEFAVVTEEELDSVVAEEYAHIQAIGAKLASNLPSVKLPNEPSKPLGFGSLRTEELDFGILVDTRRRHQTDQAINGVRKRHTGQRKATLRAQVIHEFHAALKSAQDDAAVGTGAERGLRWTQHAPGGRTGQIGLPAGNAANAAVVATQVAKKAASRRREIFTKAGVPCLPQLVGACISTHRPLKVKACGFIMTDEGVRLGYVTAFYSKGGGKNGKHANITESTDISAVSYLAIQVFQHRVSRDFNLVTESTAAFQTREFGLLPSTHFLCLLDDIPKPNVTGLEVSARDLLRYRTLQEGFAKLQKAFELLKKRTKGTAAPAAVAADSDDSE